MKSNPWLGLALLLACSDAGASGSTADGAKLSELSPAESAAVCDDINREAHADREYVSRVCTGVGRLAVGIGDLSCTEQRDACIADPEPLCWPADGTGTEGPDCPELTVATFKACLLSTVGRSKQTYANVSCTTTDAELSALLDQAMTLLTTLTPECQEVQRVCPEFFPEP